MNAEQGKKEKRKRDRKRDAGNGPQLFALQELDDEEAAAQLAAMPWSTPAQVCIMHAHLHGWSLDMLDAFPANHMGLVQT